MSSPSAPEQLRHSLAHLLGSVITTMYPHAKLTLGPAIENGFYYDIDFSGGETPGDNTLEEITKNMRSAMKSWTQFTHTEVSLEEGLTHYKDNPYKSELIKEIAERGESITLYTCGEFTDLCRGGHVENLSAYSPECFVLERIAGAYWRGDEKNTMLTRIYGLAFETKEELDAYIHQQEEAKKRDHRKLGKELKLFTVSDLVGSGLPLFQPKGAILRRELENYLWELHKHRGYHRVWTPHLAKLALYETSGHGKHYVDDMFSVHGGTSKEDFYLKPMNCPHHMQLFADNQLSYRDMPVRYFEPATVYRDEKTGQLGGLTRVRSITQDDGHLFCRASQIHEEVSSIVGIIKEFYGTMGMLEGYRVRLSLRDDTSDNYLGSNEVWAKAEGALTDVCTSQNLPYFEGKGEAAFYGPKLDFMFKDAIGREHQLATVQCDFNLPERFDLSFTNESGEAERPVVIHRAISGSLERFLGVMIEHFAGAFPVWLAPLQVRVIPVNVEAHGEYAKEIADVLMRHDIRIDCDSSSETLGKRIREAKVQKVPYIIVIGDKEKTSNTITVEGRGDLKLEQITVSEFTTRIADEIKARVC